MRLVPIFIGVLALAASSRAAAQEILWQRQLGGPDAELAVDVVHLDDGDLLVVGGRDESIPSDSASGGLTVARVALDGTVRWQRQPLVTGIVHPIAIVDDRDGTCRIIGEHTPQGGDGSQRRVWLATIDTAGEIRSQKLIGPSGIDVASARRAGGGFIVAGSIDRDAIVVLLDADGEPVWERRLDAGDSTSAASAMPLFDEGFVATGSVRIGDSTSLWLQLIADDGAPGASTTYSRGAATSGSDVLPTPDGGFVVTGTELDHPRSRFGRAIVAKYTLALDTLWTVTRPLWIRRTDSVGINEPYRIIRWGSGSVLVVGATGPDNSVPFTWRLEENGTTVALSILGGVEFSASTGRSALPLADGGYVVVGSKYRRMLVMRVGAGGTTGVDSDVPVPQELDLSAVTPRHLAE
jgi:hypothetical protein